MLEGHTDLVWDVAISTDGAKIVSGGYDEIVRVWSMETGEVPSSLLACMAQLSSLMPEVTFQQL